MANLRAAGLVHISVPRSFLVTCLRMSLTFPSSLMREGLPPTASDAKKTLWIDKVHEHEGEDSFWFMKIEFGKWLQYDGDNRNYYFTIGSSDVGEIQMMDWHMLRFYGAIIDEK